MAIEEKQWLDLSEGEKVLWWNHPHIIHYLGGIASSLFIMVGGVALMLYDIPLITEGLYPLVLVPVGLGLLIWQLWRRANHYYVATNYKIVEKRGIFSRHRDPIHYDRMQDTKTTESVAERIISLLPGFNIGDIIILTAATDRAELILYDVPNVQRVSQIIEDHKREYNAGNNDLRQQPRQQSQHPGHDTPSADDPYGPADDARGDPTDSNSSYLDR